MLHARLGSVYTRVCMCKTQMERIKRDAQSISILISITARLVHARTQHTPQPHHHHNTHARRAIIIPPALQLNNFFNIAMRAQTRHTTTCVCVCVFIRMRDTVSGDNSIDEHRRTKGFNFGWMCIYVVR